MERIIASSKRENEAASSAPSQSVLEEFRNHPRATIASFRHVPSSWQKSGKLFIIHNLCSNVEKV